MLRRAFLVSALGLLIAAPLLPARAADFADTAAQMVSAMAVEAKTKLEDPALNDQQREQTFRTLLEQYFDVEATGKFVLGKYWRAATDAEKTEYLKLFEDLIVRTYAPKIPEYIGTQFKVLNAKSDRADYASVLSEAVLPTGERARVTWRIVNRNGGPKVIDVTVEGSFSLARTRGDEFADIIQRSGGKVEGLLQYLRQKTAGT